MYIGIDADSRGDLPTSIANGPHAKAGLKRSAFLVAEGDAPLREPLALLRTAPKLKVFIHPFLRHQRQLPAEHLLRGPAREPLCGSVPKQYRDVRCQNKSGYGGIAKDVRKEGDI